MTPSSRGIRASIRPPGRLYVVSSRRRDDLLGYAVGGCQGAEDLAAGVALEAAADLLGCFALGQLPLHVGPGRRVGAHAGEHDGVDRAVEPPVAAAVEAMSDRLARRCRDRAGAGNLCERGCSAAGRH